MKKFQNYNIQENSIENDQNIYLSKPTLVINVKFQFYSNLYFQNSQQPASVMPSLPRLVAVNLVKFYLINKLQLLLDPKIGLKTSDRRQWIKTYHNCFTGIFKKTLKFN